MPHEWLPDTLVWVRSAPPHLDGERLLAKVLYKVGRVDGEYCVDDEYCIEYVSSGNRGAVPAHWLTGAELPDVSSLDAALALLTEA